MTIKLTGQQEQVLRAIVTWAKPHEPDHHDIAMACGRTYSAADWAHGKLRKLLDLGLIEAVGRKRHSGSRTWKVTEIGVALLAAMDDKT